MIVRRIARPLLSTVFIAGGIDSLRNAAPKAQAAGPFLDKAAGSLPGSVTGKLPSDPETLVRINAAVQVGAGTLLALGKAPRAAALALAGTLVPTTVAGHDFWNVQDPQQRAAQRMQFFKNMTMLGGLLIAAVDTEGKPSLGWRGRRAAQQAQESIVDAFSHTDRPDTDRLHDVAEQVQSRATEWAHLARERGAALGEVARERGSEWADTAREHGTDWIETAREHGTEWAEAAGEQGEILSRKARKRAERALATAREKAAELQN
ncbi:DoxX family protein [Prescottella sp. R16]|uniref:DoxX family protein n=1 Tax=Prescottella sp. R16 TaxID=3064529 RepID=UPI00272E074B|nr:DoxX family protein [Prescottella sp. R16]